MILDSKKSKVSLAGLFYAGKHNDVVELAIDRPDAGFKTADLPFVIGGLAYAGRLVEAQDLLQLRTNDLTDAAEAAANCYLSIGLCRHSEYAQTVSLLATLLSRFRHNHRPMVRFHVFMAMGFYRFFSCRFDAALRLGKRAFDAAKAADFVFGKFLATDLIGHALARTGRVHEGLAALRRAEEFAKCLGQGGFVDGTRVAIACYSAQFGLNPHSAVDELTVLLTSVKSQDTYTKASLSLELARQLSLRGQISASQKTLDKVCELIYAANHRRYAAVLNLRYAQNLYLMNEIHQALNLITGAIAILNHQVDHALLMEALGLKSKVLNSLAIQPQDHSDSRQVAALTRYTGSAIGQRILARLTKTPKIQEIGRDPLADLLDNIESLAPTPSEKLQMLVASGYLGLFPRAFGLTPSMLHSLVIGPSSLVIVNRGDVCYRDVSLTPLLRRLLYALAAGEQSKSSLTMELWGQTYRSARHDSLIYNLISRLREIFGEHAAWIQNGEGSYLLANHVTVFPRPTKLESPVSLAGKLAAAEAKKADLNFRQLDLLASKDVAKFVDVQTCVGRFEISRVTAMRDLSHLCSLGILSRVGKGRATKYCFH